MVLEQKVTSDIIQFALSPFCGAIKVRWCTELNPNQTGCERQASIRPHAAELLPPLPLPFNLRNSLPLFTWRQRNSVWKDLHPKLRGPRSIHYSCTHLWSHKFNTTLGHLERWLPVHKSTVLFRSSSARCRSSLHNNSNIKSALHHRLHSLYRYPSCPHQGMEGQA